MRSKTNLEPSGPRFRGIRGEPDDVDGPDRLERGPRYPAFDGPASVFAAQEKVEPDLHVLRIQKWESEICSVKLVTW